MLALRLTSVPRGLNVRSSTKSYSTKVEAKPAATQELRRPEKVHAKRLKRRTVSQKKVAGQKLLTERMATYFHLKRRPTKIVRSKSMKMLASVLPSFPSTFDVNEFELSNEEYKSLGIAAETVTAAKLWNVFPEVLPKFTPSINLKVKHSDSVLVYRGIAIDSVKVQEKPLVKFEGKEGAFYTVMMIDPDIPLKSGEQDVWNHYTVTNVTGNDLEKGQLLVDWVPPAPPKDTGVHRYIWLLLEQNGQIAFTEPVQASRDFKHRIINFADFVAKYHLKPKGICFHRTEFDKDVADLYQAWGGSHRGFNLRDYHKKQVIKPKQYQTM